MAILNHKEKINQRVLDGASILLAALILCGMAIYNGFPLVFNNDTGMYIENAFSPLVPDDRPKLYGLFIRFSSLMLSLWLVVISQALIVALILFYYFKYYRNKKDYHLNYLLFVTTVSLLMGASFEVSWLMPDIFTSLAILCLGLLLLIDKLGHFNKLIISAILILSIGVHNSHLYLCFGILICFACGFMFKSIRDMYRKINLTVRRISCCFMLACFGFLFMGFVQYYFDDTFKTSRGGSVFVLSNMIEMGVINIYLDDNCSKKYCTLCKYKDSLPNNFLWDYNSPIKKTGGWAANAEEYSLIVKDVFTTPKYMKMVAYKSFIYTFKQFFNFDLIDIWRPSDRINNAVKEHYAHDYPSHMRTKEYNYRFKLGFLNFIQSIIVGMTLLTFFIIVKYRLIDSRLRTFICFIVLGLIINAWICASFSGVYPRYQARVIWLLPLPLFLHFSLTPVFSKLKTILKTKSGKN